MEPKLKPPGTKRLQLKCDIVLSTSAFNSNLRRYIKLEERQEREQKREEERLERERVKEEVKAAR